MSKKRSSKQNKSNNFPFANQIKKMKEEFKQVIDEMSDEEFIDFTFTLCLMSEEVDEEFENFDFDEETWDNEEVPF